MTPSGDDGLGDLPRRALASRASEPLQERIQDEGGGMERKMEEKPISFFLPNTLHTIRTY